MELEGVELCLDHFLEDVEERARNFNRRLGEEGGEQPLVQAALQFAMLTAAKIATIGIHNPPSEELARGRLLHAMLLLTDLRERAERRAAN
jgi:hypothetical protein